MYPPEIRVVICERIANGESLRAICAGDGMPDKSTVFAWLASDEAFSDQYARARALQAEHMAEEILEIADDGRNDWMERNADEDAGWVHNGEHSQRSRLRVDARKWLMSKMAPKKYGDKVSQEISGPGGSAIPHEHSMRPTLTKDEWLALHGLGRAGG